MDNKELCLELLNADTEDEVIGLLTTAGFWDENDCWRYYGDFENNFSVIGNQQSRPDSALMEKLINSVDARLMNECLVRGISPESDKAPKSVREAVAIFFEDVENPSSVCDGLMSSWPESKRKEVSSGITLASTGPSPKLGNPCFTIADIGEGQTPEMFPKTLLSLNKSNKLRIPFVQGRFNMGGTGVLQFCGRNNLQSNNLQLVISRRNPSLLDKESDGNETDKHWGFTIVRRERPRGNLRNSVYTYLAPTGAEISPGKGRVISFQSSSLPIFPERNEPYCRESEWGTCIKLYEYDAVGFKSHILMRDGLLSRTNLLLPEIALPIRFHECREYKGHGGSFDTTLTGLGVRLEDDKAKNLEYGFPDSTVIRVAGQEMKVKIYAFKKGTAETYRKSECVIFIVNGQTQAHLRSDFLRRTRVGMSYISDSVLISVDCSKFSKEVIEDLFMNSRDRLRSGELRNYIENELEEFIKNHEGLRALREKRRREDLEEKLDESKPLADMLAAIIKQSPTLSSLFFTGNRLQTPFKTKKVKGQEEDFVGAKHPTYFKFKDFDYGTTLERECNVNMRCRVIFETDVENEYFDRIENPGSFTLTCTSDEGDKIVDTYMLNLRNGIATLSISLPEGSDDGDIYMFSAKVEDETLIAPFINGLIVTVKGPIAAKQSKGKKSKPPSEKKGDDREQPSGIEMPNIVDIHEEEWEKYKFDKFSALRVKNVGIDNGDSGEHSENATDKRVYDFFINIDNVFLKTELKQNYEDVEVIRARFRYGLVMLGLALLQDDSVEIESSEEEGGNDIDVEERIYGVSRAVAPILLPMIESLGGLNTSDFE